MPREDYWMQATAFIPAAMHQRGTCMPYPFDDLNFLHRSVLSDLLTQPEPPAYSWRNVMLVLPDARERASFSTDKTQSFSFGKR